MMDPDDLLDPETLRALEPLHQVPARDPERAASGLANFLAVAHTPPANRLQRLIMSADGVSGNGHHKPAPAFRFDLDRSGFRFFLITLLFALLLSGSVFTSLAAKDSLPGDTLYPVKTALEDARVTLNPNSVKDLELHMLFARRRLDEISALIAKGRFEAVNSASALFRFHIDHALQALRQIYSSNPVKAQELALDITLALSDYAHTLDRLRLLVPEVEAPALEQALDASRLSPDPPRVIQDAPTPRPQATAQFFEVHPSPAPPEATPFSSEPTPAASPSTAAPAVFDLDIQKIHISKHIRLDQVKPVEIRLDILNSSPVDGQGVVVVSGVQNGAEVYRQRLEVALPALEKQSATSFPAYTPAASGDILWTVTIEDGDPDSDESLASTAVTTSETADNGGTLDIDIEKFKAAKKVQLAKVKAVELHLKITASGEGQGSALLTGVQNGAEIYSQSIELSSGLKEYDFPAYTPTAAGEIIWTVTLTDGDPDADTATESTAVVP